MGILGIENRDENWKTAKYFAPYIANSNASRALATHLLKQHDPNLAIKEDEEVKLELFWKGMRDFLNKEEPSAEELSDKVAEIYNKRFYNLRWKIEQFHGLKLPNDWNYCVSNKYAQDKLFSNLVGTEIDIVLATRNHLFIGEAKYESDLGKDGNLFLVHQLIRQYVMARILVAIKGDTLKVVPFVVGNEPGATKLKGDVARLKKTAQVNFMKNRGWLKKDNVLSWEDIKKLSGTGP